ncbi:MAG: hypothetical protein HY897_19055 [Deltaproteobacteria bacterium]|nr:hypothetical protein [Deltaproteobacteria bacterium]
MKRDPFSTRVCDLGLTVNGSIFGRLTRRVHRELRAKGIVLRPNWYLSSEYGCVVDSCNVGLKWVEAIGQIPALARRFGHLFRPEPEILMTLRHEAGHAFCYVHRLYRLRRFRALFEVKGDFYGRYPDDGWAPTAADRRRFREGRHISLHCLKHPDEDFSITFQTWLWPGSRWRTRYAAWPGIMEKFAFVGEMVRRYGSRPHKNDDNDLDVPISDLTYIAGAYLRQEKIHRPGGGCGYHGNQIR